MTKLFTVNKTSTAAEVFDDEMIVINFREGTYSTLSGSGADIFTMLNEPHSVASISAALALKTKISDDQIEMEVATFIQTLLEAKLIVESDGNSDSQTPTTNAQYQAPQIETFHDLSDLMQLDPIHEVDTSEGWPHQPSDT
jgi:hypothetical protein